MALASEASYGFGEGFAYLSSSNEDELFAVLRFDHYLQDVLGRQFARAKKIIESHRHEVERVAEALLANGSLTGEELRDLVAEQPRLRLVDDGADKRAS